jgi:hypothetical protein
MKKDLAFRLRARAKNAVLGNAARDLLNEAAQFIETFGGEPAQRAEAATQFIAVGYIDHQGGARWEPGKGPGDLLPDQLIYVSHLPPGMNNGEGTK